MKNAIRHDSATPYAIFSNIDILTVGEYDVVY